MNNVKEFWFELKNKNQIDGEAMVYCEKVDGLNNNAIHVIEYDIYEKVCKDKSSNDEDYIKCSIELQTELNKNKKLVEALEFYARHHHHLNTTAPNFAREAVDEVKK